MYLGLDSGASSRSPPQVECGRCGRSNPSHVKYCLDCGSDVQKLNSQPPVAPKARQGANAHSEEENVVCFACGMNNPRSSSFCRECGVRLNASPLREGIEEGKQEEFVEKHAPVTPEASRPLGGTLIASSHPTANISSSIGTLVSAREGLEPETPVPQAERGIAQQKSRAAQLNRHGGALASPRKRAAEAPQPQEAPVPPQVRSGRLCRACGASSGSVARFCQLCGLPFESGSGERPRSNPPSALSTADLPDARLVVIAQDGSPGRKYPLTSVKTTIGNGDADISLRKDPYVSPEHAHITYRNGCFYLEDHSSLNGVFIRLGGSVPLTSGDLLLIGLAVLRFEIVEESERNLAPQARDGTRIFGTPPAPRYARLTTQTVEGVARDRYYLSRAETVLGREVGDIVFTDDPFMSRRHAAIQRDPTTGQFSVRDLGSSNGTFIALRSEHTLAPGDHIRVGQHLFRLDIRNNR